MQVTGYTICGTSVVSAFDGMLVIDVWDTTSITHFSQLLNEWKKHYDFFHIATNKVPRKPENVNKLAHVNVRLSHSN